MASLNPTAAYAFQNLDHFDVMQRSLRAYYSSQVQENSSTPEAFKDGNLHNCSWITTSVGQHIGESSSPAAFPTRNGSTTNLSGPNVTSLALDTLSASWLTNFLGQLRLLCLSDPLQGAQLFKEHPQLADAVLQAMMRLNMVGTDVLSWVVEHDSSKLLSEGEDFTSCMLGHCGEKAALLYQVMCLTEEQISEISTEQQQQLMELRERLQH